ncbi:DinB family protein [Aneurinibacillus migulanus]|uniref:Uncharacterized damage-inducible protein DinB (Forms a four-helix bundle) n=1 Tax=Aneurinibacillus migulanus TaxID=47500 RepID=A0A0D1XS01_ANEMI|nr:DinB family protein [Aneurinibacillus migulanus]KIV54938.1 hypothetical protein TS65_17225 [Aneurinibacillus migulanus]KON94391.1 hypothetical protein AF333_01665 [Aneurinibacillus migulanus]MED0896263.1 DinB family protein [Aneurinibacillus migulanus]MED1615148.1 DinB family protein [Aneurinibacillus migulanus]SDK14927.1 Uncharacterized damage-inducible protein DinB (forms a four-helix bundle) [Aneurinibacillus migulanus]
MKNEFVMKQFAIARSRLLSALENVTEEAASQKPEGFNNNIHWHAGHILLVTEKFFFKAPTGASELPELYDEYFANGTKPEDWKSMPPSLQEIIELLTNQEKRIKETGITNLDRELDSPLNFKSGLKMGTTGELANMAIYHEGVHTGYIYAMKRLVTKQTTNA